MSSHLQFSDGFLREVLQADWRPAGAVRLPPTIVLETPADVLSPRSQPIQEQKQNDFKNVHGYQHSILKGDKVFHEIKETLNTRERTQKNPYYVRSIIAQPNLPTSWLVLLSLSPPPTQPTNTASTLTSKANIRVQGAPNQNPIKGYGHWGALLLVKTYCLLIGPARVPPDWLIFNIQYLSPQTSESKSDKSSGPFH